MHAHHVKYACNLPVRPHCKPSISVFKRFSPSSLPAAQQDVLRLDAMVLLVQLNVRRLLEEHCLGRRINIITQKVRARKGMQQCLRHLCGTHKQGSGGGQHVCEFTGARTLMMDLNTRKSARLPINQPLIAGCSFYSKPSPQPEDNLSRVKANMAVCDISAGTAARVRRHWWRTAAAAHTM